MKIKINNNIIELKREKGTKRKRKIIKSCLQKSEKNYENI